MGLIYKINEKYKKNKVIINIFFIIFIIKLLFFVNFNVNLTPDSKEYIDINGFNIFSLKLHEYRVPLYPLFIEIFERVFNEIALEFICFIQLIVSYISSIYLYKTFNIFSNKKYISILIVTVYSCSIVIMGWDKTILTESFSLSLTIFIIYNVINYLKCKKIKSVINIALINIIGTFIRPTFMIYSVIIFLFFILRGLFIKNERKSYIKNSFISLIPIILILAYCTIFYKQYNQFSLTNSLLGQQITVMAQTDLYKLGTDEEIKNTIDIAIREENGYKRYIVSREYVMNLYDRERISKFIKEIKSKNIIAYGKEIIKIIWNESPRNFESYYKYYSDVFIIPHIGYIMNEFIRYSINFAQGIIVALICGVLCIIKVIKKKKFDWIYFGLFGFITATYFTSIIGTNAEYQRTAITSLPFITLAIYLFLIKIIDFIKLTDNENIVGKNIEIK